MRRFGVFLVAVLAAALFVYSASADRGSWNNWHVHDGHPELGVDSTGLTHRALAIFPTIFGASYATTPSRWAYCPDATDKSLVGGDGGAKANAGHCENESYIIHLQGIATGAPAPEGWTALAPSGGFTIYYLLTPR